jgi:hypothetical protein
MTEWGEKQIAGRSGVPSRKTPAPTAADLVPARREPDSPGCRTVGERWTIRPRPVPPADSNDSSCRGHPGRTTTMPRSPPPQQPLRRPGTAAKSGAALSNSDTSSPTCAWTCTIISAEDSESHQPAVPNQGRPGRTPAELSLRQDRSAELDAGPPHADAGAARPDGDLSKTLAHHHIPSSPR